MVNIIDRNHPAGIKAYTSQISRLRGKEKTSDSKPTSDSCKDRVLLSPMAKEIQMVTSQLQEIPDVRIEKVVEIKNQIAEGSYTVSSDQIAHRLIRESVLNEIE